MTDQPAYQVVLVQQFSFRAKNRTLACIFSDIAALDSNNNTTPASVNISAFDQRWIPKCKTNSLKMVENNTF